MKQEWTQTIILVNWKKDEKNPSFFYTFQFKIFQSEYKTEVYFNLKLFNPFFIQIYSNFLIQTWKKSVIKICFFIPVSTHCMITKIVISVNEKM